MIDFRLREPKSIICLTIGSRGDVQPFISLCKGFLEEGHRPIIATHAEFEPWIRHYGIDFRPVAGDPTEIMRLCVENDMFTVSFIREAFSKVDAFFSPVNTQNLTFFPVSWLDRSASKVFLEGLPKH